MLDLFSWFLFLFFVFLSFYGGYVEDNTLLIRAKNHQKIKNIENIVTSQDLKLNMIIDLLNARNK